MKSKTAIVLMALGLLWGVSASARDTSPDHMQLVIEKIRADKKLFISQNMELSEKEAATFWPVYDAYQDELFLLRARTLKLIGDYADAYSDMSDAAAKKLLDEYMAIEALGVKIRQAYLPRFRDALPDIKVVRYYQLENKIQAALMYELGAAIPLAGNQK